jgi:hypothetical protein
MTVKVSLDINASPAVTVNPQKTHVNNGNATVDWVPAADQQAFTFVGVTISPAGHFDAPVITPPGGTVQMSVTEQPPYVPDTDFSYQITVNLDGTDYQSASLTISKPGDPVIHNN